MLGALICERAGVLNLGIEGIFTAGAMAGWMAVWLGVDLWPALARRRSSSARSSASSTRRSPCRSACRSTSRGIGITLLATSLSYFIYRTALPDVTTPPRIEPFRPLDIPVLSDLPFLGPALFSQTALTYLAFVLVAVVAWVLYRTPLGLALRAVGDNPDSVDAQGLSVYALRTGAVVAGSALMALGGAFLTMSAFDAFFFGMVNGRGWICIALTVFASWRPGKALLGALLFGAFDAFQVRLQTQVGAFLPSQVFLMLPYLLAIVALVLVARKADYPRALLVPWFKGTR